MPLDGWIAIAIGAWCLVSVPVGLATGRLLKRTTEVVRVDPVIHLRATTHSLASDRQDIVRRDNERLLTAAQEARTGEEARIVFLCECRDELCAEYVRLTLAQYDTERAAHGLILYPGHIPVEDEPIAAGARPPDELSPTSRMRTASPPTETVAPARTPEKRRHLDKPLKLSAAAVEAFDAARQGREARVSRSRTDPPRSIKP